MLTEYEGNVNKSDFMLKESEGIQDEEGPTLSGRPHELHIDEVESPPV